MKSLIIGAGQVGQALFEVLSPFYDLTMRDLADWPVDDVQVLHICYPDHKHFDETTQKYIEQYKPSLTIIHSSVQVGTTEKCGKDVVYSPTRGRHPRLAIEMTNFIKFVASGNLDKAIMARNYFLNCNWPSAIANSTESLEFFKVFSNVHMGLEIAWRQEAERMMRVLGIDAEEYDQWEESYRDGCLKNKDFNLIRSIMRPDPIGGHCILPCLDILRDKFKSPLLDYIVESNERKKSE